MIDVDKLATFRIVLEAGSFSAAADRLHLTQPAVSRQISLLERRLGVELVRRTQRGVHPTEAGHLLATHAGAVLDRLERAEAELADLAGLRQGTIRLGAFFTAMVHLSAETAMALAQRHPGLRIVDDLADRAEALAKLSRGQLDIALVFDYDTEPSPDLDDVEVITLFHDPLRVLLPVHHRLTSRPEIHLDELRDEPWICAHDGTLARLTYKVLQTHGITPTILAAGHGEEPIEAQALVAAGRGITLAHDLNVIINPEQIAVRPLAGHASVRHIRALHLPGHRNPGIAAVIEVLRRIAQQHQERLEQPANAATSETVA